MGDDTVEKLIDAVFKFAPTPSHSDDYLRFCAALDALIAAVRAEEGRAAFRYAMRCNADDTTGEVTCPDGDIAPNPDAAYMHYLLTVSS